MTSRVEIPLEIVVGWQGAEPFGFPTTLIWPNKTIQSLIFIAFSFLLRNRSTNSCKMSRRSRISPLRPLFIDDAYSDILIEILDNLPVLHVFRMIRVSDFSFPVR